jgi:hypothetical protein
MSIERVGGVERAERNASFRNIRRLLVALDVSWKDFGRHVDRTMHGDDNQAGDATRR